jgi:hypothetical protein
MGKGARTEMRIHTIVEGRTVDTIVESVKEDAKHEGVVRLANHDWDERLELSVIDRVFIRVH